MLRPGGTVLITVPVVWEYDSENPEHHYTGAWASQGCSEGWDEVRVVENGGGRRLGDPERHAAQPVRLVTAWARSAALRHRSSWR